MPPALCAGLTARAQSATATWMMSYAHPRARAWPGHRAWVACGFLVLCFVLGGSSRFVLFAHLGLRLASLAVIGHALWTMTPADRTKARNPARAVIALGTLMALQLVPLPPEVWGALPGHGFYEAPLREVGLANQWRPMSMAPDLTLNSILSLLPSLAAALVFAPLRDEEQQLVLNVLLACVAVAAVLSAAQIASDGLYLYPHNSQGTGVGFFANRNHQTLFLAIGIILVLARWRLAKHPGRPAKILLALVAAAAILPFLIVAGSRTGLAAGALAFAGGGAVFARGVLARQARWMRWALPLGALILVVAAFAAAALSSRQLAVDRLLDTASTLSTTELRTANLPALVQMARAFFPLGCGFGTFDAVFRRFESDALLRPTYFNHAHSEPIELMIEGGVPAVLLMLAGLVWLAIRARILFTSDARSTEPALILARLGVLGLTLLVLGSLVDYPLRTPFLAVISTLLATWAASPRTTEALGKGQSSGLGTAGRFK